MGGRGGDEKGHHARRERHYNALHAPPTRDRSRHTPRGRRRPTCRAGGRGSAARRAAQPPLPAGTPPPLGARTAPRTGGAGFWRCCPAGTARAACAQAQPAKTTNAEARRASAHTALPRRHRTRAAARARVREARARRGARLQDARLDGRHDRRSRVRPVGGCNLARDDRQVRDDRLAAAWREERAEGDRALALAC